MSDPKQFRRHYKYSNLDAEELRKRREDTTIMLRKQKRDEQLLKKRSVLSAEASAAGDDFDSDSGINTQDFNYNAQGSVGIRRALIDHAG